MPPPHNNTAVSGAPVLSIAQRVESRLSWLKDRAALIFNGIPISDAAAKVAASAIDHQDQILVGPSTPTMMPGLWLAQHEKRTHSGNTSITLVVGASAIGMQHEVSFLGNSGTPAKFLDIAGYKIDRENALRAAKEGRVSILYTTPELLAHEAGRTMEGIPINRLVIRDAEQISPRHTHHRPAFRTVLNHFLGGVRPKLSLLFGSCVNSIPEQVAAPLKLKDPFQLANVADKYFASVQFRDFKGEREKFAGLAQLLASTAPHRVLVFCPTDLECDNLFRAVSKTGVNPALVTNQCDEERLHAQWARVDAGSARVVCCSAPINWQLSRENFGAFIYYGAPSSPAELLTFTDSPLAGHGGQVYMLQTPFDLMRARHRSCPRQPTRKELQVALSVLDKSMTRKFSPEQIQERSLQSAYLTPSSLAASWNALTRSGVIFNERGRLYRPPATSTDSADIVVVEQRGSSGRDAVESGLADLLAADLQRRPRGLGSPFSSIDTSAKTRIDKLVPFDQRFVDDLLSDLSKKNFEFETLIDVLSTPYEGKSRAVQKYQFAKQDAAALLYDLSVRGYINLIDLGHMTLVVMGEVGRHRFVSIQRNTLAKPTTYAELTERAFCPENSILMRRVLEDSVVRKISTNYSWGRAPTWFLHVSIAMLNMPRAVDGAQFTIDCLRLGPKRCGVKANDVKRLLLHFLGDIIPDGAFD